MDETENKDSQEMEPEGGTVTISRRKLLLAILILAIGAGIWMVLHRATFSESGIYWRSDVQSITNDTFWDSTGVLFEPDYMKWAIAGIEKGRFGGYLAVDGTKIFDNSADSILALEKGLLILVDDSSRKSDTLKGLHLNEDCEADYYGPFIDPKGRYILIWDPIGHDCYTLYRITLKNGKLGYCKLANLFCDRENWKKCANNELNENARTLFLPIYESSGDIKRVKEVNLTWDQLATITPEGLKQIKQHNTRYF